MSRRRMCVVTGGRAEYGQLYWLLREINEDPELQLQLVVTGMHLSPEFGLTYRKIEEDGFVIDTKVEMLLSGDSPAAIGKSMALGLIGFCDLFARERPDCLILLGDRFEAMAAGQAAMLFRIPIAHVSGGETTEGGIDEAIRHSLTKMALFHFVSAEPYRARVIQLGESPDRVFNCGDLGHENIDRLPLLNRHALGEAIGFDLSGPFFLVTYHPETLTGISNAEAADNLLLALDAFPDYGVLITTANADEGGRAINQRIDAYVRSRANRAMASPALGPVRYLSAMKHAAAVVGNSSSGIVEAPVLKTPTVNVGDRQAGRLMATSVICCRNRPVDIDAAIRTALSDEFRRRLPETASLYGLGQTAAFIKNFLKTASLEGVVKRFHDTE